MSMSAVKARVENQVKPATWDHLKAKRPLTQRLKVCLEEIPSPNSDDFWEPGTTPSDFQRAAYDQAVAAWREEVNEHSMFITMRGVGRKKYNELLDEFPPSDAQIAEAKNKGIDPPDWNPETFAPALIYASMSDPRPPSKAEMQELFDEWTQGDVTRLFLSALAVNSGTQIEQWSKGSGRT